MFYHHYVMTVVEGLLTALHVCGNIIGVVVVFSGANLNADCIKYFLKSIFLKM